MSHFQAFTGYSRWLAAAGFLAVAGPGCIPHAMTARPHVERVTEDEIEIPDGTPSELVEFVQSELKQAQETLQQSATRGDPHKRRNQIKRQIYTVSKAADHIQAQSEANDDQQKTARTAKFTALYLGAQQYPATFEHRLSDFVATLADEFPGSIEAAVAAACLIDIRYMSTNVPKDEVLRRLADFAKEYPDFAAGVELFDRYGRKLESAGDRNGAIECYQNAITLCGHHAKTQKIAQRLNQLQGKVHSENSRLGALRMRLGNHDTGYFVLYAEEHPSVRPNANMYWYRYEYDVVEDFEGAVKYIDSLPPNWSWKMIRWYPHTDDGRDDAHKFRIKLQKQKKTGNH